MKPSIYNFFYERSPGKNIGYNTFTKAIVMLDDSECAALRSVSESGCVLDDDNMSEVLIHNGFIVEDDFSEVAFLKYFHYKTKFSNDQLSLTIAPTLDCNFACPYCYENPRSGKMSQEVQKCILAYIKQKIDEGVKKLDVTWYGGEPLLYPEIVDYLASSVNSYATEKEVSVGMSLVTNGYLITYGIVDMFVKNNIHSIQITLDGLETHHNQRRFLRGGAGTFNKIIDNLSLFKGTPIRVNIRMNVDQYNCEDYAMLKELIDSFDGFEIALYPSAVENINEREEERKEYYMNSKDYEAFIVDSHKNDRLADGGLDVIDDRRYFCAAELENSYVVDEMGNFYKCWDDIGNKNSVCFNILDIGNINYYQMAKYMAIDPFSDERCIECKFLPLCFGGCKFQKNTLQKSVCNFSDETLRLFLESKYFSE